jgi:hypothetical protein
MKSVYKAPAITHHGKTAPSLPATTTTSARRRAASVDEEEAYQPPIPQQEAPPKKTVSFSITYLHLFSIHPVIQSSIPELLRLPRFANLHPTYLMLLILLNLLLLFILLIYPSHHQKKEVSPPKDTSSGGAGGSGGGGGGRVAEELRQQIRELRSELSQVREQAQQTATLQLQIKDWLGDVLKPSLKKFKEETEASLTSLKSQLEVSFSSLLIPFNCSPSHASSSFLHPILFSLFLFFLFSFFILQSTSLILLYSLLLPYCYLFLSLFISPSPCFIFLLFRTALSFKTHSSLLPDRTHSSKRVGSQVYRTLSFSFFVLFLFQSSISLFFLFWSLYLSYLFSKIKWERW